jgi:hypothetical protein
MIRVLHAADVDFVVIGGLAILLHGGDHVTVDGAFAYQRSLENARRIAEALRPYHPMPTAWPEGLPFVWDAQTIFGSTVLTLETDLGRLDLGQPDGSPVFRILKERSVETALGDINIRVAAIDDLIAMKRAAGRFKDLGHIAELESIKKILAETET